MKYFAPLKRLPYFLMQCVQLLELSELKYEMLIDTDTLNFPLTHSCNNGIIFKIDEHKF